MLRLHAASSKELVRRARRLPKATTAPSAADNPGKPAGQSVDLMRRGKRLQEGARLAVEKLEHGVPAARATTRPDSIQLKSVLYASALDRS